MRFPAPLKPGDRIGVTSPSSGVAADLWPRLKFAVGVVESRGSNPAPLSPGQLVSGL